MVFYFGVGVEGVGVKPKSELMRLAWLTCCNGLLGLRLSDHFLGVGACISLHRPLHSKHVIPFGSASTMNASLFLSENA